MMRSLDLTVERLVAYSRSGNFHSDPDAAATLGYTGMVAQGMQVAGPAYGILLDTWGEALLDHGAIDFKFVGLVYDGQAVDAEVEIADGTATFTVCEGDRVVAVGSARER